MKIDSFQALFIDQLKDLYSAEKQLVKALPNLIKAATSVELKEAINGHLQETKEQVRRLEQIFASRDLEPETNTCEAMKGLIKESKEAMKVTPEIRDAAIIAAAQRVEHYEISAYGTARQYAQMLGLNDAATLLRETLTEELGADRKLNALAVDHINWQALNQTSLGETAAHL